jgi:hypothetical protein
LPHDPHGLPSPRVTWQETLRDVEPDEVYMHFHEDAENETIPQPPDQDALGKEMEDLKQRRKRGELQLAQLRERMRETKQAIKTAPVVQPRPEMETEEEAGAPPNAWDADPLLPRRERDYLDALAGTGTERVVGHRHRPPRHGKPLQQQRAGKETAASEAYYNQLERAFQITQDESAPYLYDACRDLRSDTYPAYDGPVYDPMGAEQQKALLAAGQRRPVDTAYTRGRTQASPRPVKPYKAHTHSAASWAHIQTALFVLGLAAVVAASYFGFNAMVGRRGEASTGEAQASPAEVFPTTIDGVAAHTVLIPGKEGTQIFIQELQKSYPVTGGEAEIQIADYTWFEDLENVQTDDMTVTLTPYVKYATGEQTRLGLIQYTINVPLSPIQLIRPESIFAKVSTSIFDIRIQVEKNSRVIINGENMTDMIDMNGRVSKNVPVLPIGENRVQISVRSKYHRQNNLELLLYRDPQEIPLELAADTPSEASTENTLRIYASTLPGAQVTIESPYDSIDTATLEADGNFSFVARFPDIGDNEVRVRAKAAGRADSVVTHIMYYMPPPEVYTRKAWPFDRANYVDLVNHPVLRKGTVYVCKGTIRRIVSERPQIAEMDAGTDGQEQLVLLENSSKTIWQIDKQYSVYGDAFGGLYDNMPRIIARYTYEK